MFSPSEFKSSLLFFASLYPVISFQFRDSTTSIGKSRRNALWICAFFITAAFAIKFYAEMETEPNFYQRLEVGRHSSTIEMRQAWKKLSKKLHPDKNPLPNAEEKFQDVKDAYDVLMDETQRDIYNRFGSESLSFDPRHDELKLLSSIAMKYLWWGVATYIFTLPAGARACRTWAAIAGLVIMIVEVSLSLFESSIPQWLPSHWTEHLFCQYLHCTFPAIVAALRCISEYFYVDVDKTSVKVLKELSETHKSMISMLHQLQVLVSPERQDVETISNVSQKIEGLKENISIATESIDQIVDVLKNSSSNPGSNYYWIIFVAMYGGMYLFQN